MWSRFRLGGVLAVVLWLGVGGCYWVRYDALARTHVALLLDMVAKLEDVTGQGRSPEMAEYRYPLDRARDFVRIVERRFAGRESLVALGALCDAYERTLEHGRQPDAGGVAAAAIEVRARAAAVIDALDREAGS